MFFLIFLWTSFLCGAVFSVPVYFLSFLLIKAQFLIKKTMHFFQPSCLTIELGFDINVKLMSKSFVNTFFCEIVPKFDFLITYSMMLTSHALNFVDPFE